MKIKLKDCVIDDWGSFLYRIGYTPEDYRPDVEDVIMKLYDRIEKLENDSKPVDVSGWQTSKRPKAHKF